MRTAADAYALALLNSSYNSEAAGRCPECYLANGRHDSACSQIDPGDRG